MKKITGLVLTAGGARAAYQAGVLKGIAEILGTSENPFRVIGGISAGAINGCTFASHAADFGKAISMLSTLWSDLRSNQVIRTDIPALARVSVRWMRDLSLGGLTGRAGSTHLLDTSPLRRFLTDQIDFAKMETNLRNGTLFGVAVSATSYKTGTAITFFDGDPSIQPWVRSSRLGQRAKLTLPHVLASASIPVLFAPVPIGRAFYGDGSIRLNAPLSPAVHLGADRVLAIGIRYTRTVETVLEINEKAKMGSISLADVCGVMLNASLLDTMDADVERLERINQTVGLMSEEQRAKHPGRLKHIPLLVIRPSQDLGSLASNQFRKYPRMLRYLLSGIGASSEQGWDFLSYLAFDRAYTKLLVELGCQDALDLKQEIRAFFA